MRNPQSADEMNGRGQQVSFQLQHHRQPMYTDWMKYRVDREKGKRVYSHRMSVVEPVFGNICANRGLTRFSLRGLKKVNAQGNCFVWCRILRNWQIMGDW